MKTKEKSVEYCENKFPETTKEFKNILNEMYVTFCKKQHDYGPSNISLGRDLSVAKNRKKSLQGLWFRSNDKLSRVDNILEQNISAKNEPLEDSYLDLANYSVISLLVKKNIWGK
jgi:hypothetical protein|tara:strand:- start:187 stop:531 length:345 start_codon:yes stop_codon:yes gene_type:complete